MPGGLPPGFAGPPSAQLAPAYVYSQAKRHVIPVTQLFGGPPVADHGIARVSAPVTGPWNVTLSPYRLDGQASAPAGRWLGERDDVQQALLRWGTPEAGFEAVIDWQLGASLTLWGSYVDVTLRIKMGGGGAVLASLGTQAVSYAATIQPGSGPGHAAYRRPTFTEQPNSGAQVPVPKFARWLWLQPDDQLVAVSTVDFLTGNGSLLARYEMNPGGASPGDWLRPLPVPHRCEQTVITDNAGSVLKYQYELELG